MASDEVVRKAVSRRYCFADAELDVSNLRLTVGTEVRSLEPKSFRLLVFLIENRERTVSKDEIMATVWPDTFVTDNALTRAIVQIRKALGDDARDPKYIETVPTVGYRFIALEVSDLPGEALTGDVGGSNPIVSASVPGPPQANRSRVTLFAGLVAVMALALAGIWWRVRRDANSPRLLAAVRITKLTYFPGEETDPAFSPDGRNVAFSYRSEQGVIRGICVMAVGGQKPVLATRNQGTDISPVWSPDGRQIAFIRLSTISSGNLMVVPASGGSERIVRPFRIREDMYRAMRPLLAWTPDGKGIAYTAQDDVSERAVLYLTDLEGKSARKLFEADVSSVGATAPAFSPDGKWLAYTEIFGPYEARLYVRPLTAGLPILGEDSPIAGAGGTLITSPTWDPTGKRLLYMENSSIMQWQLGSAPKRIYVGTGLADMAVAWGSGETLRVVVAEADRAEADRAELQMIRLRPGGLEPEGKSTLFVPYTGQSGPVFSPDGKLVVFHSSRSGSDEIWVVDSDGHNPRQLSHLNATVSAYPKWSPDGKQVTFHSWVGSKPQIYTLDVDRSLKAEADGKPADTATKITDSEFGFFSPAWSTDGRFIYANRATGGSRIFRIPAQGGMPEELFEGACGVLTPDGRRIVYSKIGHLGIFSRSLDGDPATNPEEKLVDDYRPPGADLNPVSDGVYYISWNDANKPRVIRFYNYARKKSVDIVEVSGRIPATPGLTVSPDRRRLLYSQFTTTEKDLTLIEFQ